MGGGDGVRGGGGLVPIAIQLKVLVPSVMVPGSWDHLAKCPLSGDHHSEPHHFRGVGSVIEDRSRF